VGSEILVFHARLCLDAISHGSPMA
jgi:hypothetical protein